MRAFAVRNPIDSPSIAPARNSDSSSRPRATSGIRRPRKQPAMIFAQLEPDADRLGRIVLKQHWDRRIPSRGERLCKGAAHHHVARLLDLAKQAGVALDSAVGVDRGARRKNGRRRGFG
jgi:hypothetical protein